MERTQGNHVTIRRRAMAALALTLAILATVLPSGAPPAAGAVTFTTRGSIGQVATWGHAPGTTVELHDNAGGTPLAEAPADAQGAVLFREVDPGTGYTVTTSDGTSDPVTVTAPDDHPDQSFYDAIDLTTGYGYIPTRDGTLLSATVTMPIAGATSGPYPTVVTYSGYDPSQPGATLPEALPYLILGYAVVAVNMRGSGCSGGAFDYYEPATSTDGYDVIEAVAAQDWSNGRVGMVGISYSGISQLYVAATQPPHLTAITPLSPYADAYRGILYPGGIRNEGFALDWALDRQAAAQPAARPWVRERINGGDTTCAQNQVLRLQSRDIESEILPYRFDDDVVGEHLAISNIADRIEVPTYLAAQFQDEQTGGSAVFLAEQIQANGQPFRAVFGNGAHADPLGPTEYIRVLEFVDMYVGRKVSDSTLLRQLAPDLMRDIFEDPIDLPPDRFAGMTYEDALALYEQDAPVRVRYEVGGVAGREGAPYATAERTYDAWPVPGTTADRWYLQPDGALATTPPTVADDAARATSTYRYDPDTAPPTYVDRPTGDMWKRHPDVRWPSPEEDAHLTFTTPAATTTAVYAGSGSVDLWVGSSAADTDLEAVLTEVRPDGQEVYVQSGWLRASHRALDPARSTELRPWPTHMEPDAAPIPAGELVPVRMELFPFAHVVRPGSRLRLTIQAPGGNQPFWDFTNLPGEATNRIGHSVGMPSSIALPLVDDAGAVAALPAAAPSCSVPGVTVQSQSLRNQPCRADRAPRRPTAVVATASGTSVEVQWAAPEPWADGAGPTGYEVTLTPGDHTATVAGDATSAVVDGLTPGATYTAVVTPTYAAGGGVASDASAPVTLVASSAGSSFVRAAWADFLDREPTATELADVGGAVDDGSRTRRSVVTDLARSTEWVATVVERLYTDTLGRPSDAAGRTFWVDQIRSGRRTVAQVAASFYGSGEYIDRVGGTTTAWVEDLYPTLLGRAGEPDGVAYWVEHADRRGRGWVALQFFQSAESARARVERLYQELLGRAAEPAGVAFWAPRVVARGDLALAVELASSAEYLARARTRFP